MADVTVELGKPRPRTAVAKKFAELVTEKGKSPNEAADLLGIKIDSAGASQMRREVEGVIRGYTMKPEAAKVLVRAARNKLLIDALGTDGHEYDPKIALEAAKQIASDPDVGLTAAPVPMVQLQFGNIEELLSQIDVKDVIVDVTPDNVNESEPNGEGESKVVKLAPGPYATHFQEYAHDRYFNAPMEKETYTQRPRVSLGDFLANRLGAALKEVDKDAEI